MINSSFRPTLSIGRRQMKRGESKAKTLKRGGRIRSAAAKAKTRAGRKDASAAALGKEARSKNAGVERGAAAAGRDAPKYLQVISSSPGVLAPVFETMLENATRVCEAKFGNLLLYDGSTFRIVSVSQHALGICRGTTGARRSLHSLMLPGDVWFVPSKLVHVPDLRTDASYQAGNPMDVAMVERAGARSMILVPMLREGQLLGAFGIFRQEVRPFTDKQIELVNTLPSRPSSRSRTRGS